MRIRAVIGGREVQVVQIVREGSNSYVDYIDVANSAGPGPLVSTVFRTSAADNPNIVISTSAVFVA